MTPTDLKAIRERDAAAPSTNPRWEGYVEVCDDRNALLRLLDDLTGDLLAVEWVGTICEGMMHDGASCCPRCGALRYVPHGMSHLLHEATCSLDARLTQLGLATQTERDAERARRAGK